MEFEIVRYSDGILPGQGSPDQPDDDGGDDEIEEDEADKNGKSGSKIPGQK